MFNITSSHNKMNYNVFTVDNKYKKATIVVYN